MNKYVVLYELYSEIKMDTVYRSKTVEAENLDDLFYKLNQNCIFKSDIVQIMRVKPSLQEALGGSCAENPLDILED